MKKLILLTLTFVFAFAAVSLAERTPEFEEKLKKHKEIYRFFPKVDTMYTIEGEFPLPENYHWGDIDKMNDYQKYIADFPIWNRYISAVNWYRNKIIDADSLSRVVHITWDGGQYREIAFPVRILAEYFLKKDEKFKFDVMPKSGESINYEKWLKGSPKYNARMELFFADDQKKEDTELEYFKMVNFSLNNLSFKSLIESSDQVPADDLMPGDFFLATNSRYKDGVVYFVMHYIVGDDGLKKYVVATGCPKACDFHIPLFNNNKDNPFITVEEIENLAQQYPNYSFYRFKALK